jgi:hypothetical protein
MSEKIENPSAAPESRNLAVDVPVFATKRAHFRLGELVSFRPELLLANQGGARAMMVTGRSVMCREPDIYELTVAFVLRVPMDLTGSAWDLQVRTLSFPETAFVPYVAPEEQK